MSILLFEHNLKAFDSVKLAWKTTNRTCVIHATGTGKSLIVAKNIEENPTAKHLFLSPSTFIFEEIQKHLPKKIAKNIHFQSYAFFLDKEDLIDDKFLNLDFIYLDEFHRIGATQWGNAVQNILEKNTTAKILGTSATPIRYLDDNRNMAEELFNNNIASELPLGEAILQGIHQKPKYVSALYNYNKILSNTKNKIQKSKLDTNNKNSELDRLRSVEIDWNKSKGLKNILKKHLNIERKKILVFCRDTEHREEAQKLLQPILDIIFKYKIGCYAVGSDLTEKTNIETINYFRSNVNEASVLFSVNMLNEGLHLESTDTCVFLRDTESPIIYFQQLGRVFHTNQKTQPLIIDLINNFKLSYGGGGFTNKAFESFGKKIVDQNHDLSLIIDFHDEIKDFEQLIESFKIEDWNVIYKEVKIYFKEHNKLPNGKSGVLVNWIVRQKYSFNNDALSKERIDLLLEITPNFFENVLEEIWKQNYSKAKNYFEQHNKLPVGYEGLGQWITTQKHNGNNNMLSIERIDLLLEITPNFFENLLDKVWKDKYDETKTYFEQHNKLPILAISNLIGWANYQRTCFNNDTLSKERIDLLLEITPNFFENVLDKVWKDKYDEAKTYFEQHNKLPASSMRSLQIWVNNQKGGFKKNILSKERIDLLLEITPEFFENRIEDWNVKYEEFKSYFQKYKKLPPSNSMGLGKWITTQKHNGNNNMLSIERIDLLLEITPKFFENLLDQIWEQNYSLAKNYFENKKKKKFNKKEVQQANNFIANQLKRFNNNFLDTEKINLLRELKPNSFKVS